MSQDPYCYSGTDVLRNRFDIRHPEELRATEARVAAIALIALENEPLQGPANEDRLKATHRAIFSNVYDWAGSFRQNVGTMTKGRAAGYNVTYGDSQFVLSEMRRIFSELGSESYLSALNPDRFATRLAYFYSELDSTHPFREGNSRTLRKFSTDLAVQAGYHLDWEPTGRTENSRSPLYLARDLAFTLRKYQPLNDIILENLRPVQS